MAASGCGGQLMVSGLEQQQQQQRLYKGGPGTVVDGAGGALLSPVDSGIGPELSLLEHAKQVGGTQDAHAQFRSPFWSKVSKRFSASTVVDKSLPMGVLQEKRVVRPKV